MLSEKQDLLLKHVIHFDTIESRKLGESNDKIKKELYRLFFDWN